MSDHSQSSHQQSQAGPDLISLFINSHLIRHFIRQYFIMFTVALLTTLTLAGLRTLSMATPIAQQGAPYTNGTNPGANPVAQGNTPNTNVPAGYQVGFATVSPCPNFLYPHTLPSAFILLPLIELIFVTIHSKTRNPLANKVPAQLAVASAAPRHLYIPVPLDRISCQLAFTQRPLWDLDPLIALFAGPAIASYRRGDPTAIQTVAVARESPTYNPLLVGNVDGCFSSCAVSLAGMKSRAGRRRSKS